MLHFFPSLSLSPVALTNPIFGNSIRFSSGFANMRKEIHYESDSINLSSIEGSERKKWQRKNSADFENFVVILCSFSTDLYFWTVCNDHQSKSETTSG